MTKENINDNKEIKFIVLYGEPNSGKTTTLNELIISLIKKEDIENFYVEHIGRKWKFENMNPEDVKTYLEQKGKKTKDGIYRFKCNGKNCIVITAGDFLETLIGTIISRIIYKLYKIDKRNNKFETNNELTDVVICAARSKWYDKFKNIILQVLPCKEKGIMEIKKIKESKEEKQDEANREAANEIEKKLYSLTI